MHVTRPSTRARLNRIAWLALLLIPLGGCPNPVDFHDRETRMTRGTAYTLPAKTFETGFGVVGTGYEDLLISVPVRAGLGDGWEISTNAAHDLLGVLNAHAKYTIKDFEDWTLGARLGVTWINIENIWFIPEDAEIVEDLAGINLFLVPFTLTGSFPVYKWLDTHLQLGYTHSAIGGNVDIDSALAQGQFGARELYLLPHASVYALKSGIAFLAGVQIPLWAAVQVSASGESPVPGVPGLVIGFNSNELTEVDIKKLYTVYLGMEMRYDQLAVRLNTVHGWRFLTSRNEAVIPSFDMIWRF